MAAIIVLDANLQALTTFEEDITHPFGSEALRQIVLSRIAELSLDITHLKRPITAVRAVLSGAERMVILA